MSVARFDVLGLLAMNLKELSRHVLPDGAVAIVALARRARSSKLMRGWARIDPRPWGKLGAVWRRDDGAFVLEHCSHPTALRPWMIRAARGRPSTSKKFSQLREALAWIDARERRR